MTTERKARLKYEIKLGIKYVAYIWIATGCVAAVAFALSQESLERQFPTPHEWSFQTRLHFRGGSCEQDETDPTHTVNRLAVMRWFEGCLERLEDPKIDGKDLKDAPSDCPPGTRDITAKSEEWRRGYYEAMMHYAKAAEQTDGWVMDKSRGIIFPGDVVVGPSNPKPKPLMPGFKGAPREENCEPAFESADAIYLRILSTEGFNNRQKIEAGLAYATWLEHKGITGPAAIVYEDALQLAVSEKQALLPPTQQQIVDPKTWVLNEAAGLPSANILKCLTAYATFRARSGDISSALPILVSILKARRSLPEPSDPSVQLRLAAQRQREKDSSSTGILGKLTGVLTERPYPPPPEDGTEPPIRDPKEMCEEAALSLHIGEIMYTSSDATREEGLGWTREAVDIAEEQLHRLGKAKRDRAARKTCRECLGSGLDNWSTMVKRLAKEEAARKEEAESKKAKASWLGGLWGVGKQEDLTRWLAEEQVIAERTRRSQKLLDELDQPAHIVSSILTA